MQEALLYIYKRGATLYFVFKHSGFVMEFNYSKNHINELLKLLQKEYPHCQDLHITTLKAYDKFVPTTQKPPPYRSLYTERAKGDFEINTDNKEIEEILQKIKKAIRKNGSS